MSIHGHTVDKDTEEAPHKVGGSKEKILENERNGTGTVEESVCSPLSLTLSLHNSLSAQLSAQRRGAPGSRLRSQGFAPAMLLEPVAANACFACLSSLSPLSSATLLCCSGCSSRCALANSSQWRTPEHLAVVFPPFFFVS